MRGEITTVSTLLRCSALVPSSNLMLSPRIIIQRIESIKPSNLSSPGLKTGKDPIFHHFRARTIAPTLPTHPSLQIRSVSWLDSRGNGGCCCFQVVPQKEFVRLNKTLKDLCYCGRLMEAVRLLCDSGVRVEPGLYALLLQECINRKAFRKGRIVHGQMVAMGYVPNEFLKTKLLIFYMKSGNRAVANVLFGCLVDRTLISWNSMIAGYVQSGDCEGIALDLFYELRWNGLVPDQYTFASVFRACASFATLEHGRRAHCILIKCQLRDNVVVSSALLDMYFKCSSVSDGRRVFDESSERNVVTWTALIAGYGLHGMAAEVLDSFRGMINGGFRPNYVTFLAVLSACSHRGMLDEGWEYFTSMSRVYGIKPRRQHYAAMVDLLGRAGQLKEASQLILKSPCEEHPVVWGALLESCRTRGAGDLLQHATKKYFELEPENAGKYVVLCNAYATFGFWDSVAAVRKVMKDSGMAKEPAYSRIEVKDAVHFFFKGDNSHEESERIFAMAKDIQNVLHDVSSLPDWTIN